MALAAAADLEEQAIDLDAHSDLLNAYARETSGRERSGREQLVADNRRSGSSAEPRAIEGHLHAVISLG